jgi:hypothetical protein
MAMRTLADLVKINDQNLADINVTDLLEDAPLLARLHAMESSNGTEHKYLKDTTSAGAGFRSLNDGIAVTASAQTLVTLTLKILEASFPLDLAYCTGYAKGVQAAIDHEGVRKLKAAMSRYEKQIIYGTGTGGNADGHAGFADNAGYNHKDDAQVVDAAGTTAGTGSSVWLLRTGPDDVAAVMKGGNIEWGESVLTMAQGTNGPYPAYYTPITGWTTVQLGSIYSVVRICNLTEDSGKGLTDDLISKAIAKIPAGKRSNLLLAGSRRSQRQLQDSRTATNPTGEPAPMPESAFGIPFIVTDSILDTEALLAAA